MSCASRADRHTTVNGAVDDPLQRRFGGRRETEVPNNGDIRSPKSHRDTFGSWRPEKRSTISVDGHRK
jgi:hypothetical protein